MGRKVIPPIISKPRNLYGTGAFLCLLRSSPAEEIGEALAQFQYNSFFLKNQIKKSPLPYPAGKLRKRMKTRTPDKARGEGLLADSAVTDTATTGSGI